MGVLVFAQVIATNILFLFQYIIIYLLQFLSARQLFLPKKRSRLLLGTYGLGEVTLGMLPGLPASPAPIKRSYSQYAGEISKSAGFNLKIAFRLSMVSNLLQYMLLLGLDAYKDPAYTLMHTTRALSMVLLPRFGETCRDA